MQLNILLIGLLGLAVAAPVNEGKRAHIGEAVERVAELDRRRIFTHLVSTTGEEGDTQEYADGSEDPDAKKWKRPIFTHLVPAEGKNDDAQEYADGSEDPDAKKWKRPIFTHLVPAEGEDTSTEEEDT